MVWPPVFLIPGPVPTYSAKPSPSLHVSHNKMPYNPIRPHHRVIEMSNSHFELKQMCTLTLLPAKAALYEAIPVWSEVLPIYHIPCQILTKRYFLNFQIVPRQTCLLIHLISKLTLYLIHFHLSINSSCIVEFP